MSGGGLILDGRTPLLSFLLFRIPPSFPCHLFLSFPIHPSLLSPPLPQSVHLSALSSSIRRFPFHLTALGSTLYPLCVDIQHTQDGFLALHEDLEVDE